MTKTIEETKTNCREKILIEKKEQIKGSLMGFNYSYYLLKHFRLDELEHPPSRMNSPKANNHNNVHILIDPVSKKLDIPSVCREKLKYFFIGFL